MRRSSRKLVLLHSTPLNSKLDAAQGKTQARLSSLRKIIHQHLATIQLHTYGQRATTKSVRIVCGGREIRKVQSRPQAKGRTKKVNEATIELATKQSNKHQPAES